MRVLLYNWSPYDVLPKQGGGVSVACKHNIDLLLERGASVAFLYAGIDYSLWPSPPHVRKRMSKVHPNVYVYSIVNSGAFAPALLSTDRILSQVREPGLEACFRDFLTETGPYDVIHFHSSEGLSVRCIQVAKESSARVLYTAHNHWPICPQVNLRKNNERICYDFNEGRDCVTCQGSHHWLRGTVTTWKRAVDLFRILRWTHWSGPESLDALLRAHSWLSGFSPRLMQFVNRFFLPRTRSVAPEHLEALAGQYRNRRHVMVQTLNEASDQVLPVSDLVARNLTLNGLQPIKLSASGLPRARLVAPVGNPARPSPDGEIRLVYLGKMSEEKGPFLLADEIARLPEDLRARLNVLYAGPSLPSFQGGRRIDAMVRGIRRFEYLSEYAPSDLSRVLQGRHLGVVPSLCYDTLPLVALEMLSCGVPVLLSDRCGAKERIRHPAFVFAPDQPDDFHRKLIALLRSPELLADFWRYTSVPKFDGDPERRLWDAYRSPQNAPTDSRSSVTNRHS